jgi:replicative DNA helicase
MSTNSPVAPARTHLPSLGELLKNRGNAPHIQLKTLPELSYKMWGLQPRELMCIAARTSMGKSSLALQVALDVASQGHHVLYLSLEMTVLSMLERMFCNSQCVPGVEILRGNFPKYKSQWDAFCKKIESIPLILTEGQGKNWKQIDALIGQMKPMPKVIILDYIQCVSGAGFEKREVIDEYIRHLREMAIEHNFSAIIVSQINREGVQGEKDQDPAIHQLKGSGYIEELCDKIVLCHWPWWGNKNADKNQYRFILAKNRTGITGTINLRYIPEYFKFEDAQEPKVIDPVTAQAKEMFGGTVLELTANPDGTMPVLRPNDK